MSETSQPASQGPRADARLSVIVPAYNAEPYLDTALAGIAAQVRQPDEVVVVDDASTDRTSEIARRWSAVLPIELVTRPDNAGLGAARKLAIERSTGDRLALLDADDYWLPDHLAVMVDHHQDHGGLVTPNHYRWVPEALLGATPASDVEPIPPAEEQRSAILRWNFLSYGCVFWRSDYDAVGGFRELRSSEDWDLWIRMVGNGVIVSRPETVTLIYRKRPDSLSATNQTLAPNVAIFEELLQDQGLDDARRAVARTTLRRFRARHELLQGVDLASRGDVGAARRLWLRAALRDRSVRMGPGIHGSTSLRALAFMVAPGRATAQRTARVTDPVLLTRN